MERIDAVFNCAGYVHNGTILEATDEDWNFAFNLNARSQFWMIQQVIPRMLAQGWRQHHQHGQRVFQRARTPESLYLRQQQGRRHWSDQERGG